MTTARSWVWDRLGSDLRGHPAATPTALLIRHLYHQTRQPHPTPPPTPQPKVRVRIIAAVYDWANNQRSSQ